MSGKQAKRLRRAVKRQESRIIKDFFNHIAREPFFERLKAAWHVITAKELRR